MLVGQQFGPFTSKGARFRRHGDRVSRPLYQDRPDRGHQDHGSRHRPPTPPPLDRFDREIDDPQAAQSSQHRPLLGAGKYQGMRYFAMEYVEGESLDKVIARRGRD